MRMGIRNFLVYAVLVLLVSTSFATAQISRVGAGQSGSFSSGGGFASYSLQGPRPSYQTYYGGKVNDYWPALNDPESCTGRQDLMLQTAPFGCQPTVVRSDLLADQNVPVFCQLDAWKINPLVEVNQIKNIRFTGDYPPEVVGSGFHPARAALRTHDTLLGSPLVNNVGYVVLVLKQQPDESLLPDLVNVTLSAQIEYHAGNAYGVGRSEFLLEPMPSNADWERERLKQSFWDGRYFVRLDSVDIDSASVSIYYGDQKVMTKRVERGKVSDTTFLPGMYCRAGLQIAFDSFVSADKKAKIEVASGSGADVFDVSEGSRFMDNRCSIRRIDVDNSARETGRVIGECRGKSFVLELRQNLNSLFNDFIPNDGSVKFKENQVDYIFEINDKEGNLIEIYRLDKDSNFYGFLGKTGGQEIILLNSEGEYHESVKNEEKGKVSGLKNAAIQYSASRKGADFVDGAVDREVSSDARGYFDRAIDDYERVVDDYPFEKQSDFDGSEVYGEISLIEAIDLSRGFGMDATRARLIEKYLKTYPDGRKFSDYSGELDGLFEIDSSLAGEVINFDDQLRTIRLLSVDEADRKSNVELYVEDKLEVLERGKTLSLYVGDSKKGEIKLDYVDPTQALVSSYCVKERDVLGGRIGYGLRIDGESEEICGLTIRADKVNTNEVAKIRLLPWADRAQTETNFTVGVGIEKRAIELTPEKARDKIENLNRSIEEWEELADGLGDVVEGLKGACFATSALLTFKSFFSGLDGKALARQKVMGGDKGWTNWCKERLNEYQDSLNNCYLENAGQIDADVAKYAEGVGKVNEKIEAIQSLKQYKTGDNIFGDSVNSEEVQVALAKQLRENTALSEEDRVRLSEKNVRDGLVSRDAMRAIMLDLELKDSGLSSNQHLNLGLDRKKAIELIDRNIKFNSELAADAERKSNGRASAFYAVSEGKMRLADVVQPTGDFKSEFGFDDEVTHSATFIDDKAQVWILGLGEADRAKGIYSTEKVWDKDGRAYNGDVREFISDNGIGSIKSSAGMSYNNKISEFDRVVKYYETEPYRGMPAIVPFDVNKGWYAGTRQTLPAFGGIGAFDSSGRVTSFWLCNVGDNKRIEFESGFGDDLCQQINLNTGQPIGVFPGLSKSEAEAKVMEAENWIRRAAQLYGNQIVEINGERLKTGVSVGQPGTECQDFMSPKDCHLLFNVCDPVICPSSRCNFGGKYPVSNVVQTGIIGSALLCLPNAKEKILVPVCLSGIHAGIDGLVSIMRSYRDCLSESVENGNMIGICDQIYSVYTCEFFWGQIAPVAKILLPKLVEVAYGQGTRGGAEYLTVNSAWQNMENSIKYFTQSYAVNSVKSFKARSLDEVGGEVCKAWVSTKAPSAFETLVEPDSPPQFHAWFDERRFSDATVPATSQYKVFYHIYSGNDEGVYYNVYLKNPPESGIYLSAPQVPVAAGYITRGEFATETRDFTAPAGYKELCVRVNEKEECGFQQVSTSLALDILGGSIAADEAKNLNVQSEAECVSGGSHASALINPNIQAGVEEYVSPAIYNRGVVRICSTANPGLRTQPGRFVDVGFCGEEKVRCWLDKQSVENAIENSNYYGLNETLNVLEQRSIEMLQTQGKLFENSSAVGEIKSLESAWGRLQSSSGDKVIDGGEILKRADLVFSKLVWNHHKAWLLLVRARVSKEVAMSLWTREIREVPVADLSEKMCPEGYIEEGDSCVSVGDFTVESEGKFSSIEKGDSLEIDRFKFSSTSGQPLIQSILYIRGDGVELNTELFIGDNTKDNERAIYYKSTGDEVGFVESPLSELVDNEGSIITINSGSFDIKIFEEFSVGDLDGKSIVKQGENLVLKRDIVEPVEVGTCKLSFPVWKWADESRTLIGDSTSVPLGSEVLMTVKLEGSCNDKNIYFQVYEDDMLFDDPIGELLGPAMIDTDNKVAEQKWKVEWNGLLLLRPKFLFIASIGDEVKSEVSSRINNVVKSSPDNKGGDDEATEKTPESNPKKNYEITKFGFYLNDKDVTGKNVKLGSGNLRLVLEHSCDYVRLVSRHTSFGNVVNNPKLESLSFIKELDSGVAGTYTALAECRKSDGTLINGQDLDLLIDVDVVAEGLSDR
jgi:hypothetical protein